MNEKPQTSTYMEVHHHSHAHGKKKWTEYFWEFLMLFLAVFTGFLAENQREHLIEHKRAKAYAQSLLTDLQNDTADIRIADRYEAGVVRMIDTLVSFTGNSNMYEKSGQLYYYMRLTTSIYTIDWNKATIDQLISSGNLRYFTNHELVTLISAYNTTSKMIIAQENTVDTHRYRAIAYRDQVLKAQFFQRYLQLNFDDLLGGKKSSLTDSLKNMEPPFQSKDPALMNGFLNAIMATKSNRQYTSSLLYPRALKEAAAIMDLLKEEYHLK